MEEGGESGNNCPLNMSFKTVKKLEKQLNFTESTQQEMQLQQ